MRKGKRRDFPQRNAEGYSDPTAYGALHPMQAQKNEEEERLKRMVKTVKAVVEFAGFDLIERIQVRDRKSGGIYK